VRDAALRIINAAELLGIGGVLVHAISDDAQAFYEAVGFLRKRRLCPIGSAAF